MKKIIVLLQGTSNEANVSINSGEAVYKALLSSDKIKDKFSGVEKYYLDNDIYKFITFLNANKNDIVIFNALHGSIGEDGKIQSILDMMKIPYTHSGVAQSSLGMNKIFTKKIIHGFNLDINIAKDLVVYKKDFDKIDKINNINYPFIIKPITEGSSVGIFLINNLKDLENIPEKISNFNSIMIEEYIQGVELTCGVVNNRALGVTEIIPKNIFYDYASKYDINGSQHIFPANIPQEINDKIMSISLKIYEALNIKSCFRVDFIYSNKGLFLLEINTQPGMTATSLLPEQWIYGQNSTFGDLCIELISTASFD